MDRSNIVRILKSVQTGTLSVEDASERLKNLPYEDLNFAHVDHHRHLRQGIPEVIFAKGKKIDEIREIARSMYRTSGRFLITKASEEIYRAIGMRHARYYPRSGVIMVGKEPKKRKGQILILSAGTSDISIAEEAAVTATFLGSAADELYDIGVAGIHRLLDKRDRFSHATVIIVVAGMEGALPSVVGGLTDKPIIAVPTSVGYGTSLGGFTALLAMLNSCVPGIAVMNIDNGFGAGCLAHKINLLPESL